MAGRYGRLKAIVALILLAEGIILVVVPPAVAANNPVIRFAALFLIIIGAGYLLLVACGRRSATARRESGDEEGDSAKPPPLATRIIDFITYKRRLVPYLPLLGIAVFIIDIVYNWQYNNWNFGYTDTTAMLFGGILIAYGYIPDDYRFEKDFVFIFSLVLVIILILPLLATRALHGDPDENVNMYSNVLLGPSLIFTLNLIGIASKSGPAPPGPENQGFPWIYYSDQFGNEQAVGISAVCAGLYSFAIFVGIFFAYVLVSNPRFTPKIALLLGLGFLASYIANVLRMALIVMVSFYYGPGYLVWMTHEYAGLLIFLAWLSIFWVFLIKYMKSEPGKEREDDADAREDENDDGTGETDADTPGDGEDEIDVSDLQGDSPPPRLGSSQAEGSAFGRWQESPPHDREIDAKNKKRRF